MTEELFYKLLILRTPKIGPVKYAEIINIFGCAKSAADSLNHNDEFKDVIKREIDLAEKLNIKYISDDDNLYPKNLLEIKNHPPVITLRGNLSVLSKPAVSIVGTRHASGAGMKFISDIAEIFSKNGFAVVSGMAMGTDTSAHIGALRTNGDSETIAVLAGGADYIWPLENESLYHRIIERGAVISEMPIGFKPSPNNFIQRNRWIAGISDKLILGEADLKSGSMATAKFAIEYGRDVFAVPSHPIDERSKGPNKLIKDGLAKICTGIDDFFEEKTQILSKKVRPENDLFDKIGMVPVSESVLAELVKKSVSEIKCDLVVLELQGLIRKQNGGYVKI